MQSLPQMKKEICKLWNQRDPVMIKNFDRVENQISVQKEIIEQGKQKIIRDEDIMLQKMDNFSKKLKQDEEKIKPIRDQL